MRDVASEHSVAAGSIRRQVNSRSPNAAPSIEQPPGTPLRTTKASQNTVELRLPPALHVPKFHPNQTRLLIDPPLMTYAVTKKQVCVCTSVRSPVAPFSRPARPAALLGRFPPSVAARRPPGARVRVVLRRREVAPSASETVPTDPAAKPYSKKGGERRFPCVVCYLPMEGFSA